jgi:ubiquitin carboxyl-terminal hydrolase 8
MTIAEIKEKTKDSVQKNARGFAALRLITSARTQYSIARTSEDKGDLEEAFESFTKAAALTQLFMDSAELQAERQPGKHGVLYKEFHEFISVCPSSSIQSVTELR